MWDNDDLCQILSCLSDAVKKAGAFRSYKNFERLIILVMDIAGMARRDGAGTKKSIAGLQNVSAILMERI